MSKYFFDYDDGDFVHIIFDDLAIDSDGNMMIRIDDDIAMDMNSGDTHFISSWSDKDVDD